ncbi:hypothetical protein J6590_070087 [Homalodisca vitripennis]|nr:hypothetical protein J6590_070087 [Homalodisca vitripennis]
MISDCCNEASEQSQNQVFSESSFVREWELQSFSKPFMPCLLLCSSASFHAQLNPSSFLPSFKQPMTDSTFAKTLEISRDSLCGEDIGLAQNIAQ